MSTFYILQISVNDPVKLKEYTNAAPTTVKSFRGELVFRGNVSSIVSGNPDYTAAVVLKFPDMASAEAWYSSEDYQGLIENRDAAADVIATRYDESDFY